jgi:hypothetical protein
MLFVIVMEVLNSMIVEADRQQILSRFLGSVMQQRASLYADDMVVFVSPSARDLRCLRAIRECFVGASGLVTNMDKCQASPIRCSAEEMALVQQAFPCCITPFPCKYLGVPVSIYRLHRAEEQPLVDAVAVKIPTWKSGLLTGTGRALLTKVTLSAIPVHVAIASCLSQCAIS